MIILETWFLESIEIERVNAIVRGRVMEMVKSVLFGEERGSWRLGVCLLIMVCRVEECFEQIYEIWSR